MIDFSLFFTKKLPRGWSRSSGSAGFTLVEMLLYMGLVLVFLVVISNVFVSILENQRENIGRSAVVEQGQFLIARLSYDLAEAEVVTTPATPGDQAAQVVLTQAGQTVTYAIADGLLQRTHNGQTLALHTNDITIDTFQVTRVGTVDGTPTFRIVLTINAVAPTTPATKTRTFTTTVGLR